MNSLKFTILSLDSLCYILKTGSTFLERLWKGMCLIRDFSIEFFLFNRVVPLCNAGLFDRDESLNNLQLVECI